MDLTVYFAVDFTAAFPINFMDRTTDLGILVNYGKFRKMIRAFPETIRKICVEKNIKVFYIVCFLTDKYEI